MKDETGPMGRFLDGPACETGLNDGDGLRSDVTQRNRASDRCWMSPYARVVSSHTPCVAPPVRREKRLEK